MATDAASSASVDNRLEPRRMVGLAFVVFAFTGAMVLSRLIAAILGGLKINDPQLLGIQELTLSSVLGTALAVAAAVIAWLNPKVQETSLEVASELKKVTWPSFAETKVSTIAVIIATLVAALVLFFFDFISSKLMTEWLPGVLTWFARL